MSYDFFISYASEDREIASGIADHLIQRDLTVWYDDLILTVGDSLREELDKGLASCSYGIVILSKNFFRKNWTKIELDSLVMQHVQTDKLLLPIWHDIESDEIIEYSPMLAGIVAANTKNGLGKVVDSMLVSVAKRSGKDIYSTAPSRYFTLMREYYGQNLVLCPRCDSNRVVSQVKIDMQGASSDGPWNLYECPECDWGGRDFEIDNYFRGMSREDWDEHPWKIKDRS